MHQSTLTVFLVLECTKSGVDTGCLEIPILPKARTDKKTWCCHFEKWFVSALFTIILDYIVHVTSG